MLRKTTPRCVASNVPTLLMANGLRHMTSDAQSIHRLVLDQLPFGVYLVNPEGKITLWNDGAERLTGHLRQDVLGRLEEAALLQPNTSASSASPEPDAKIESPPQYSTARRLSLRCKDGHFLTVNFQTIPLRDEHAKSLGNIQIFEPNAPSTLHNRRQAKLGAFGCLDPLTGVLNHSMIQAHVKESLNLHALYPVPFSVLCYGVDDLDKLAARFGQAAVDAALRIVANVFEAGLRPTDFLGRWMKQEFLAILPECGETDVMKVGERLRKMVPQAGVEWWGEKLHTTVSIGAAVVHDNDTVGSLVGRAEEALRESGRSGGNRVVVIGASGVRAL
jgi:diguanylate cyclase (GGDEF)-like protein/PAS domain S-box-containing protein